MTLEDFVYTHYKKWWMRAFRGPLNLLRRKGRKWRILIGNALGLPVPDDFTMKLEWIKYFDKNPLMVTCADKFSNIRSIIADHKKFGDDVWTRFNRGHDLQKWYYGGLAQIFVQHIDKSRLFADYADAVQQIFGK